MNQTQAITDRHNKDLIILGIAGQSVLNLAALVAVWGDWPKTAAIAAEWLFASVFNWFVSERLIPRVGFERAENIRLVPNQLCVAVVGMCTGYGILTLMFVPYAAVLMGTMQTKWGNARLLFLIVFHAVFAIAWGAPPLLVACLVGLTVFWQLAGQSHARFARGLIAEREQNLLDLAAAQQNALANEKLATIGMMSAGVAHEINNPMSYVTANTRELLDVLKHTPGLTEELVEFRDEVLPGTLDGIRRVNGIVADLRRFASGEPEERETFDLAGELQAAIRLARPQLSGAQSLVAELDQTATVIGLPRQIGQVALNLIVNAIQASNENGEVRVTTACRPGEAVVRVRDTGAGIPPNVLAKLFTPFVTTKTAGKGTGLGLAVAQRMVKAHGGRIEVITAVGAGTTFEVYLPTAA